jgi:hypothetical protein
MLKYAYFLMYFVYICKNLRESPRQFFPELLVGPKKFQYLIYCSYLRKQDIGGLHFGNDLETILQVCVCDMLESLT